MATTRDIKLIIRTEVDKAIKDLDKTEKELKDIDKSAKGIGKTFGGIKGAVGGFVAALALKEIAQVTIELTKMGAAVIDVSNAFRKLPASTKLLADLRQGVRNTVPDVELMRGALQGIDLGATNEQLATFAEFARFESVRKGSDTLEVFQNILGGVFRGSTELLDNFGFSLAAVNSKIEELAIKGGKSATALSAVERRGFLAQAVLELMNERLDKTGEIATSAAERIRANAAAVENFKARIGVFLADTGDAFISFFDDALVSANNLLDYLGVGGAQRVNELAQQFKNLEAETRRQTATIETMAARYEELTRDGIILTAEEQKELNTLLQRLSQVVPGAVGQVDDYGRALSINLTSLRAFVQAQRDLLKIEKAEQLENIRDIINDSANDMEEAREQLDRFSRRLTELGKLDPTERVTGGFIQFRDEMEGFDQTLVDAGDEIKRLQNEIAELTRKSGEASSELNQAASAASLFFDLSSTSAEKLGVELGISQERAAALIDRYKELNKTIGETPESKLPTGGETKELTQQQKTELIKAQQEELKLKEETERAKAALTLRFLLLSTESELQRQQIKLNAQYDAEIASIKAIYEQRLEVAKKTGADISGIERERQEALSQVELNRTRELEALKLQAIKEADAQLNQLRGESIRRTATAEFAFRREELEKAYAEEKELTIAKYDDLKLLAGDSSEELQDIAKQLQEALTQIDRNYSDRRQQILIEETRARADAVAAQLLALDRASVDIQPTAPKSAEEVAAIENIEKEKFALRLQYLALVTQAEFAARLAQLNEQFDIEQDHLDQVYEQRIAAAIKSGEDIESLEQKRIEALNALELARATETENLKLEITRNANAQLQELRLQNAISLADQDLSIRLTALDNAFQQERSAILDQNDTRIGLAEQNGEDTTAIQEDTQKQLTFLELLYSQLRIQTFENEHQRRVFLTRQFLAVVEPAFARFFAQTISGTLTIKSAWKNMLKEMERLLISFMASKAVEGLLNLLASLGTGGLGGLGGGGLFSLLGGLFGLQSGAYIKGSPAGKIVRVGEENTDEIIIPVKRFADFLAGDYSLPGGFSIKDLPAPELPFAAVATPSAAAAAPAGSNIYFKEKIIDRTVPISGRITVETVSPDLARVRDYFVQVNREINIPDARYVDTFLTGGNSEFSEE